MDRKESHAPIPSHPFRWFPEFWELGHRRLRPQVRLLGLALLVGIIAGLGAVVFFSACQFVSHYALDLTAGYRPSAPGGEPPMFQDSTRALSPWILLIVPVVGGLLSGWIVYTFAPEAEGHGTDAAIASYHYHQGKIRPRVPIVKIIASALTLGTGGSGGREGPIAQIGAGFGSFLGGVLRLRPAERRVLMAAGMGAGVAAIFRAPLAGALFAAEILYRSPDFESEVIMPAVLASISAYCTFGMFFGWAPLFSLPDDITTLLSFNNPAGLVPYLLLVVFVAVLAMLYTRSFYGLTHIFHKLPIKPHFKPALGAFLTVLLGLGLYFAFNHDQRVLSVLSFGYGILQEGMVMTPGAPGSFHFAAILLAVAVGKILTTGLTIGSGGSGGVFGPSMVIGGCAGGALGIFFNWIGQQIGWPNVAPQPASFIIVGMAGFFAAAAKAPFSTLIMVGELTGNYNLLLPTLWVCALGFLLSDEQSIYSAQVESRALSPAHQGDYVREVLVGLNVNQFLIPGHDFPSLRAGDPLPAIIQHFTDGSYHALPVVDPQGRLLGVVGLEEVLLASQSPELRSLVVAADLMQGDVTPLLPENRLDRALELFVESDLLALPVVDGMSDKRVLGLVKRADISSTYLHHVHAPVPSPDGNQSGT